MNVAAYDGARAVAQLPLAPLARTMRRPGNVKRQDRGAGNDEEIDKAREGAPGHDVAALEVLLVHLHLAEWGGARNRERRCAADCFNDNVVCDSIFASSVVIVDAF